MSEIEQTRPVNRLRVESNSHFRGSPNLSGRQRRGGDNVRIRIAGYLGVYLLDRLAHSKSVTTSFKLRIAAGRLPPPSSIMPGVVDKIVSASSLGAPEKLQITVDDPDRGYRELRMENVLTDENVEDVKLKKRFSRRGLPH